MSFLFSDFIYPYSIEWDSFIHISIQHWEYFYIQWIRGGNNIFVIYPSSFENGSAKNTLKKLTHFADLEWNEAHLNYVLNGWEDKLRPRKYTFKKDEPYVNDAKFIASTMNSCAHSQQFAIDIYSKKHVVWINSAIRNVKHELKKRGLDESYISNYETKNFRVFICPET